MFLALAGHVLFLLCSLSGALLCSFHVVLTYNKPFSQRASQAMLHFECFFPIHADSHKQYCHVCAMKPLTCETFKQVVACFLNGTAELKRMTTVSALSLELYCHTHQLFSTNTILQVVLHSQHCLCCNIIYQLMTCTDMGIGSLICQHH